MYFISLPFRKIEEKLELSNVPQTAETESSSLSVSYLYKIRRCVHVSALKIVFCSQLLLKEDESQLKLKQPFQILLIRFPFFPYPIYKNPIHIKK